MTEPAKTWGVGVELSKDHLGALRFAALLAGNDDAIVGVHVMPPRARFDSHLPRDLAESMQAKIGADVAMLLQQAGADGRVRVEVVEENRPEVGLLATAESKQFEGLIIGRRARRDDEPLIRLGPITRRVLQRLAGPVIVVPPDFGAEGEALAPGPVVLATDLGDHGAEAARFAKLLAERLDRPLLVTHGAEALNWGLSYMPSGSFDLMVGEARERAGAELHAWVEAHGLTGAREVIFDGDPARNVAHLADTEQAAVLVTGSRKLGPLERMFMASISNELAGSCRCPTAIVPGG